MLDAIGDDVRRSGHHIDIEAFRIRLAAEIIRGCGYDQPRLSIMERGGRLFSHLYCLIELHRFCLRRVGVVLAILLHGDRERFQSMRILQTQMDGRI